MQKAISLIIISIIFLLILSIYTYKESIDKFSILSEDKLDTIITVNKAENRCTNLLETFKTGIYKIYITDVMDSKCYFDYSYLRIFKDGKLIIEDSYPYKLYADYPRHINKYSIKIDEDYKFSWEWKGNSIPPDYDVTGDKSPNLVIETYSLGAHCCFSYLIYDVGDNPHLVTKLDTYHSEYNSFYKIPNNPGLNIKTEDWSYAYWNAPYVASPAPDIYLKFNNITNKYELNISKMKKPVPDKDILNNWKKEVIENWKDNPNILWKYMLQLTYTGNWNAALEFCSSVWPKHEYMLTYMNKKYTKRAFLKDFVSVIKESEYAEGILKLNNHKIKIGWII